MDIPLKFPGKLLTQVFMDATLELPPIYPPGTLCISRGNAATTSDRAAKLHCLILSFYQTVRNKHEICHYYSALTIYNLEKRTLVVSPGFDKYWEIIFPT